MPEWKESEDGLYCYLANGYIRINLYGKFVSLEIMDDIRNYIIPKNTYIATKDLEQRKKDAINWAASIFQSWANSIKEEIKNV